MKSFQIELISVISGSNRGIAILPSNHLKTVIPAVITRKTNASATAKPDVKLNESGYVKRTTYINILLICFAQAYDTNVDIQRKYGQIISASPSA